MRFTTKDLGGKMYSKNFSFNGWSPVEWLKGNKDLFEQAVKLIPAIVVWAQTQSPAWTFIIGLGGKLVIDAIHYFIKEYK